MVLKLALSALPVASPLQTPNRMTRSVHLCKDRVPEVAPEPLSQATWTCCSIGWIAWRCCIMLGSTEKHWSFHWMLDSNAGCLGCYGHVWDNRSAVFHMSELTTRLLHHQCHLKPCPGISQSQIPVQVSEYLWKALCLVRTLVLIVKAIMAGQASSSLPSKQCSSICYSSWPGALPWMSESLSRMREMKLDQLSSSSNCFILNWAAVSLHTAHSKSSLNVNLGIRRSNPSPGLVCRWCHGRGWA